MLINETTNNLSTLIKLNMLININLPTLNPSQTFQFNTKIFFNI